MLKTITIVRKYDTIFSFERYPAYLNFLLGKLLKKKTVVYVPVPIEPCLKESFAYGSLRKFHFFLHKIILQRVNLVIAISQGVKKELKEKFQVRANEIKVVEPFIDSGLIKTLAREPLSGAELDLFTKKKAFITIARLNSQKNLELLINSFHAVNKMIKNCVLLIIGEGKERKKLESLINKLHLQKKVFLLGGKTNPIKYLARADVFVLTSHYEGLGIVLLEALACRVPIVAVDSQYGIREVIDPKLAHVNLRNTYQSNHGILIPRTQKIKAKLAAAMVYLLTDKKIKSSLNLHHQKIIAKFRPEKKYRLFLNALSSI